MGIYTFSIYGIDIENHIEKLYGFENVGCRCDYQYLINSIKCLNINDYFHIQDPDGRNVDTAYFGILVRNVINDIEKYKHIQKNIDKIFDDLKTHILSSVDQDEIEEFTACSECNTFDEAWDKLCKLKLMIVLEHPDIIAVAEFG